MVSWGGNGTDCEGDPVTPLALPPSQPSVPSLLFLSFLQQIFEASYIPEMFID